MEPFSSLVSETLLKLSECISTSNDAFSQQENDEIEEELQITANDLLDDDSDICCHRMILMFCYLIQFLSLMMS